MFKELKDTNTFAILIAGLITTTLGLISYFFSCHFGFKCNIINCAILFGVLYILFRDNLR